MQLITSTLGILAISQLVLMGLFYLAYFRKESLGLLLVLLSFCLIAYIIPRAFDSDPAATMSFADYLRGRFAAATPGVLWIVAHQLFVDDQEISVTAWFFLILYQLVRAYISFVVPFGLVEENIYTVFGGHISFLYMVGLSVHVVIMAMRELNNDLIEERRMLRGPFAVGMGLIVALIVAALLAAGLMEETIGNRFLQVATAMGFAAIFLFTLLINLVTFRLSADSQLIARRQASEPKGKTDQRKLLSDNDLKIMREIDTRMIEAKFYQEAELTIGALAKQLSVQEYKLRIIINRGLGYKNFNQFLNHYRILEACLLLEDTSQNRQISIIAHSVGFASLSSFNLAFKTLKGVTPSVYRVSQIGKQG